MLEFLTRKAHPIGIDLGSDCIKMVQLSGKGDDLRLVAAARAHIPAELRGNASAKLEWMVHTIRTMLSKYPFKGKQAACILPSRDMLIEHLRVPPMDDAQIEDALLGKAQEKLPFDVTQALVRHSVVGDVYEGSVSRKEVILMVAAQRVVQYYLQAIERAKLEVDSIDVEPFALMRGFSHLLSSDEVQDDAVMLLDMAHSGTKVLVAHGTALSFARMIPIGAEHMIRAVEKHLSVDYDQAVLMCRNLGDKATRETIKPTAVCARAAGNDTDVGSSKGGISAVACSSVQAPTQEAGGSNGPNQVIGPLLANLCEEIRSCIRYHDLMFESRPVSKVVFLGGQAKNTTLCKSIARSLGLRAQLGDPIARLDSDSCIGSHSDLSCDEKNCDWSVAFGLAMNA